MVVAKTARNGSAPAEIVGDKGADDVILESALLVDNVVRDTERLRDASRVVNVVERAAAALDRLRHALASGETALVPELQG
jgi:hypothetical protein